MKTAEVRKILVEAWGEQYNLEDIEPIWKDFFEMSEYIVSSDDIRMIEKHKIPEDIFYSYNDAKSLNYIDTYMKEFSELSEFEKYYIYRVYKTTHNHNKN